MNNPLLTALLDLSPDAPLRVLGIDLGTTNSTIAEISWDPASGQAPAVEVLDIEQITDEGLYTHYVVPSMVAVVNGALRIGKGAKDLRAKKYTSNKNLFYDTKNNIGTSRTYPAGEHGLNSPKAVAAELLRFLHAGAARSVSPQRVVVTVPASFQTAQRTDTADAAIQANLNFSDGDLLDEPIAAFLDYLLTRGQALTEQLSEPRTLLVFDFGGGTCDIALFTLSLSAEGTLDVASLAVSRYHRLGGSDIDAAIVHQALIPQLVAQNSLGNFELGFSDKKLGLEPALLSVAEALKIKLNKEQARLRSFGKPDGDATVTLPGAYTCKVGKRDLILRDPQLTAQALAKVLAPVIDADALYPYEDEYRSIQSLFLPLSDALNRSQIGPEDLDYCLLVGGSSQLLGVQDALRTYFTSTTELLIPDEDFMQTSIARGAAWHALAQTLTGEGLIRQVSHEDISLRTEQGLLSLVPQGAPLPYPQGNLYDEHHTLRLPQAVAAHQTLPLKVELVAGDGRRLTSMTWNISGPEPKGAPLALQVALDRNGVLHLDLRLHDNPERRFQVSLENPLTHVVNPQEEREEIEGLEARLRNREVLPGEMPQTLDALARLYGDLGQNEKALELMKQALRALGRPDANRLNMLGLFADRQGDFEQAEKWFREAALVKTEWNGPLFNLAMSLKRRGQHVRGADVMHEALDVEQDLPSLTLAAQLAALADRSEEQAQLRARIVEALAQLNPGSVDDWAIGWAINGAQLAGQTAMVERLKEERHRRNHKVTSSDGFLPALGK